jgi:hypothetical protein
MLRRRPSLPEVDFHSLRHSSNSLLIEEGADPILVARREQARLRRFKKSLGKSAHFLVEMWGLEPQTPCLQIAGFPCLPRKTLIL